MSDSLASSSRHCSVHYTPTSELSLLASITLWMLRTGTSVATQARTQGSHMQEINEEK